MDITSFQILRSRCKVFDDLIYGKSGYWDKNIMSIFNEEEIFNEITPDIAKQLQICILNEPTLNKIKFISGNEYLLDVLEKTINGEWRLILIDNN